MIHTGFANEILKLATGKVDVLESSGLCYLGFSSTKPNKDGTNFSEPDPTLYPSYERIQVAVAEALQYTDKWGAVADGQVANMYEFTSRECLEGDEETGWPTFYYFGIFKNKSGGVPLISDLLRDPDGVPDPETGLYPEKPLSVTKGKVAVFRAGALQLTLTVEDKVEVEETGEETGE